MWPPGVTSVGKPTISYQFEFNTTYKNDRTILVSYLGVVQDVADAAQNLVQTYTVTKSNWHSDRPLKRSCSTEQPRQRDAFTIEAITARTRPRMGFRPPIS